MQIANELVSFSALVTENPCVDFILGVDFLSFVAAEIDMELRQFIIKQNGRRITLNLDETLHSQFVPIRSVSNILLPPKTSIDIVISSPVSSLSSTFIPILTFLEHPHPFTQQKYVIVAHHLSSLSVTNHSAFTQTIPQHFCFGYPIIAPPRKSFFDHISDLCEKYKEKRNK